MPERERYDCFVIADYYCDVIITGLPELPRLGADLFGTGMGMAAGGGFITATAMNRLKLDCAWVTDLGQDLFSRYVLDQIRAEGLDETLITVHSHDLRRFSLSFSYAHDRGFISYQDDHRAPWPIEAIARYRPRAVLTNHLVPSPEYHRFMNAVRDNGGVFCLDCQFSPARLDQPGIAETLRLTDVFLPNHSEILALTASGSLEEAFEKLHSLCRLVVVKCGCEGVTAYSSGRILRVPALPVQAIDTTGAGDSFNAGLIFGLVRGWGLEDCLRAGNICGGLSTTAHGGASAVPDLDQLLTHMRTFYQRENLP